MTLNEAIEKAISGGWNPHYRNIRNEEYPRLRSEGVSLKGIARDVDIFESLLDPLFWESLGNACGWYVHSEKEYQLPMNDTERNKELNRLEDEVGVIIRANDSIAVVSPYKAYQKSWKDVWHEFIDHLADGKSIESFFEQLT